MEENEETINMEFIEVLSSISSSLSFMEEHFEKIVDKLSGIEMNTRNILS